MEVGLHIDSINSILDEIEIELILNFQNWNWNWIDLNFEISNWNWIDLIFLELNWDWIDEFFDSIRFDFSHIAIWKLTGFVSLDFIVLQIVILVEILLKAYT